MTILESLGQAETRGLDPDPFSVTCELSVVI